MNLKISSGIALAIALGGCSMTFDPIGSLGVGPNATAKPSSYRSPERTHHASPRPHQSPGPHARLPLQGIHIVRRQETLFSIARRYGVSTAALANANNLRSPRIEIGQRLRIPAPSHAAAVRPNR